MTFPKAMNRKLIIPYVMPYFAYVLIASLFEKNIPIEYSYASRLIIVPLIMIWAWKFYFPIIGPKPVYSSVITGIGAGFFCFAIWIFLIYPFVDKSSNMSWSNTAFILRTISAGFIVPVFEEIFIRGYILRLAFQWDIERKKETKQPLQVVLDEKSVNDVKPGSWSWVALFISTLAFASGHHHYEWLASIAFSIIISCLWIIRKDLISCIVAHSVTNIALAFYVFTTGKWYFW